MLVFRVHTKWMFPDAEFRLIAGSIPAYGYQKFAIVRSVLLPTINTA